MHIHVGVIIRCVVSLIFLHQAFSSTPSQLYNDNLTSLVSWDPYSLAINNNRVFILSAEFHYQRLPVPELWPDIFQKIKSQGFNAISIYFFWYYHSARPGEFDFETSGKNVQQVFDAAKEAGLWVVARAGPYDNAETNGGGLALYLADGSGGELRTSDPTYYEAWLPWIQQIGKIIAKNDITRGGPIILNQIENELIETEHDPNNTLVLYMEEIEKAFREAGVRIPFSSNEKGMRGMSWSTDYENVGGAVNVYGLDSYPGGTSCTDPNAGYNVVRTYYQWFQNVSAATQPEFLPEFEAGYIRGWGTTSYDVCASELSPQFPDVYYKNNIGQRVTLMSLYMGFGGTNWGHSGAPVVFTSYDYSAPLSEDRIIRDKMKQTKLIGLFARVSKDLYMTNLVGNGTGYAQDAAVYTWELRSANSNTGFLVVQQNETSSTSTVTFSMDFKTSEGNKTVQDITLAGRQSKIIVTDYPFGRNKLLYSTAEVLTYATLGSDALVMYTNEGQSGEFALVGALSNARFSSYGSTVVKRTPTGNTAVFRFTQTTGFTVMHFEDGTIIYLLEQQTAWNFHAPTLTNNPDVDSSQHFFVLGPYLVRSGQVHNGVASVKGDTNATTSIEVWTGDPNAKTIEWNGITLQTRRTPYGSLIGTINAPASVSLPSLSGWRTNDSFPERLQSYDDSHWVVCNKTSTLSPVKPLSLPVLFSADYGYYAGQSIYRASFASSSAPPSVNISAQHGLAAGWNAWLNGNLVGTYAGNASESSSSLAVPIGSSPYLQTSGNNVLTVLVDYSGHDETSTEYGVEDPRGLLGVTAVSSSSMTSNLTGWTWRIQGQAGGSQANIDPVRGPVNEGSFYGERLGWHLPGFDASTWQSGSPLDGIESSGVQWYVTDFELDIPGNIDAPLSVNLAAPVDTQAVRVQFYVNGYQYGKFWPLIGPQTRFPVPAGVLNTRGSNRMAVVLWAQTDQGAKLESIDLTTEGVWASGFDFDGSKWEYLRPEWQSNREQYG